MKTRAISIERISVTSSKTFDQVVKTLEGMVGHPQMSRFSEEVAAAASDAQLEAVIHRATGSSGLMVFLRLDMGEFLRKAQGGKGARSLRFLIGNPLIMRRMAKHVPDAASYAPVTILIDERRDGVYLSYDRMASLLAPYGSAEALEVARELDTKVETLLEAAAS
jgi:uncharacterized protein (DUF302 family)